MRKKEYFSPQYRIIFIGEGVMANKKGSVKKSARILRKISVIHTMKVRM